jgi:glutathione synthase/RimK-type ligase-like ATP-grasp enzyme
MWHHDHGNAQDLIAAKPILFALEHSGYKVFPNFKTAWYFDDKLAQKYLFEALNIPSPRSYAFFSKKDALLWANKASFPKVFKLRCGAGSSNVILARTRREAVSLIYKAFGRGFPAYQAWPSLKERWRKFREGKASFAEPVKGCLRFFRSPEYAKVQGREVGYAYFQDFVPGNDSDTRVIAIGDRAFALKRYTRENDFRASGSGNFGYAPELFDLRCVDLAFRITDIVKSQVGVFDFVFDSSQKPVLIEISYGFRPDGYDDCPGFWDRSLKWHATTFDPYGWMVESLL